MCLKGGQNSPCPQVYQSLICSDDARGVSNHRSVGCMIPFSDSGGGPIFRVGEAFCELEVGQPKKIPKSPKKTVNFLGLPVDLTLEKLASKLSCCQGKGACYEQHRDNEWQRHLTSRTPKGNVGWSG